MQEPNDNPRDMGRTHFQGRQQGGRILSHQRNTQLDGRGLRFSRASVIEADTVKSLLVGFHLGVPAGAVQPCAHDEDQRRSLSLAFIVDTDPGGEIQKGHGCGCCFPEIRHLTTGSGCGGSARWTDPAGQEKKSTKGHEGRRRATKGLEKAQEGPAKGWEGRRDFHQGR